MSFQVQVAKVCLTARDSLISPNGLATGYHIYSQAKCMHAYLDIPMVINICLHHKGSFHPINWGVGVSLQMIIPLNDLTYLEHKSPMAVNQWLLTWPTFVTLFSIILV